mmetsp:Transcript_392/g.760  ORF Transcript_392/g.760 Transcript_392/m.760 type:complete len:205 (-) Transcript_392:16-630(-)
MPMSTRRASPWLCARRPNASPNVCTTPRPWTCASATTPMTGQPPSTARNKICLPYAIVLWFVPNRVTAMRVKVRLNTASSTASPPLPRCLRAPNAATASPPTRYQSTCASCAETVTSVTAKKSTATPTRAAIRRSATRRVRAANIQKPPTRARTRRARTQRVRIQSSTPTRARTQPKTITQAIQRYESLAQHTIDVAAVSYSYQ